MLVDFSPTQACGTGASAPHAHGWCSLRFRFDADELALLRAAERLFGAELARRGHADSLRDALALARAGRKVAAAHVDGPLTIAESEVQLLAQAVHFAAGEVRWLSELIEPASGAYVSARERADAERRRTAIGSAFPDLVERGGWRGPGLRRALELLAERMDHALSGAAPA